MKEDKLRIVWRDKLMNARKVWIKKVLKNFMVVVLCIYMEIILESLHFFDSLEQDIKHISINGVLVCYGLVGVFFCLYTCVQKRITSVYAWIKRHRQYIMIIIFVFEIFIMYKCKENYQWWICIVEYILMYGLIDSLAYKNFEYTFCGNTQINSNYVEKPVVGIEKLTLCQRKALIQLRDLIDKRVKTDSFNIGLIGAWGVGKTCITDTLICEYEKEKRYFILKLGILSLRKTKNIVDYVKTYFEDLFKKYEIGMGGRNIAYLATLSKCFGNTGLIGDIVGNEERHGFVDLEKEKELFTRQLAELLQVSGRKNVLFFIDDTDRSDDEEQIIKLLIEFASIDGIISIVSLDKSKDRIIRPGGIGDDEQVYNQIDKYIHVRVRIDEDKRVEYNKGITEQIVMAFEQISFKKLCYVSCDEDNIKKSLFENRKDYPTTEIVGPRNFLQNTNNLLTEIMIRNLKMHSKQFGSYFEEIINTYMCATKELSPYVKNMIEIPIEKWTQDLYMLKFQWIMPMDMEGFDWLNRMQSNSGTLFWTICQGIEALELVDKEKNDFKQEVKNIEDVYDYWEIKNLPFNGRTWKNRKEKPVLYSGLEQIKLIVFCKEELEILNSQIDKGDLLKAKNIMVEKAEGVIWMYLLSMVLSDFMDYFRSVLNNYRTFKMQLREAELINMNYLDYILKEWQPRKSLKDNYEKMKENSEIIRNMNVSLPSVSVFVNNVLFNNYILKNVDRFTKGKLKQARVFLHYGEKETIIVISKKGSSVLESVFLNISGEIIRELSQNDIDEIERKNILIWQD